MRVRPLVGLSRTASHRGAGGKIAPPSAAEELPAEEAREQNMRTSTNGAKRNRSRVAIAGATALGGLSLAAGNAAADCGDLAGKTYGDAMITAATSVAPPSSLMGLDPPAPVAIHGPFCRVEGMIKTSDRSHVRFEVWLPQQNAWNGKVQGVGNGGFAGSLILAPMDWALQADTPSRRPTRATPAARSMRPGRSATRTRSSTSAGGRSTGRPKPPRPSSPTIITSRRRTPISAAAPTADVKR